MKNIAIRNTPALGAALKTRRLALHWSQQQLADQIGTQRQWVIRLEAGSEGAELGLVLKAINALGLSLAVSVDSKSAAARDAPGSDLYEVFARLESPAKRTK